MAGYIGNFATGSVVYLTFNSVDNQSNPATLTGGTVKVYKDSGNTEVTTGITLSTDFDSRTGLHLVTVDTSSDGTFYAAGHEFVAVITAGTVKNTSVAGVAIGSFSLQNRYAGAATVSGTVTANVTQWNSSNVATPDTAGYPKVTIKSGSGTGELDVASGVVKANLAQILGTALTETAGLLAGGFKKFFNVATPAATMDHGVLVDTVTTYTGNTVQTGDAYARLGAPAGASVSADVAAVKGVLPSALVSGRIDASVGAMAANVLTATAINADAITDAKVASDVTIASVTGAVGSVTGAVGSVTGNVGGNVVGSVASVTAGVTVTTNNDKTGYGLSAAAVQAVWDALTSALTTVGSIGKRLADDIDATISSRGTSTYAGGDTSGTTTLLSRIASALTITGGNVDVNDKTGFALTSAYDPAKTASQAGDAMALTSGERTSTATAVWASATRSLTTFGTLVADIWAAVADSAGVTTLLSRLTGTRATNLDNLDATISSRLATTGYTAPLDAAGTRSAIGLASANLDTQVAGVPAAVRDVSNSSPAAGSFGEAARNADAKAADLQSRIPAALTGGGNLKADAQVVSDKTGYALTSGERDSIAAALLDLADGVETSYTVRQTLRLMAAALLGKVSGADANAPLFRDVNDTTDRITATTDANGNRTDVTLDAA